MTRKRKRDAAVQYLYDDKACLGFIERMVNGKWRAVKSGREIGLFDGREQALAALDDEACPFGPDDAAHS
jgi:hypothetical protein